MYVTTDAVETFVETHYRFQIKTLDQEVKELNGMEHAVDKVQLDGRQELLRLLHHCCEDEVHHQQEARERAARGPFPWFEVVDTGWRWLVMRGSAVAAGLANLI